MWIIGLLFNKARAKNIFKKETLQSYELYSLIDKSGTIKNPESYIGEPSKWFGMLYVDVIKTNDDDIRAPTYT